MTFSELASTLKHMYDSAPKRDCVAMIHLFAIKYAKELDAMDESITDLLQKAELPSSYRTEINKGKRLSKYVICK